MADRLVEQARVGLKLMMNRFFTLLLMCFLAVPVTSAAGLDLFGGFSSDAPLVSQKDDFLEPDQAFVVSVSQPDEKHLLIRMDIAEGYYLYKDKFKFVTNTSGFSLGDVNFPPAKVKEDPYFGKMEVYVDAQEFLLPVVGQTTSAGEIELNVAYQGCAEAGICYPPINKTLPVQLVAVSSVSKPILPNKAGVKDLSESDGIARMLSDGSIWMIFVGFFGFGLALSLTPCVFPMIPILSGIIVGQGHKLTTGHAFMLSFVYVIAMALTYAVIGILAGLFGQNLQAIFQDPRLLVAFSLVFVALAFSMFGFYDIQLPASWQARLSNISNHQDKGTYHGVFVMGLLSALIVGPCVAPPLAGTLIYIGQTGDGLIGGLALFVMGMGMGVPLLVIGASAGKWLPRAGVWMEAVKNVFGVLMLGLAIWLLERILPAAVTMMLWALLLIISSIYMGALDTLDAVASSWRRLWKGLGLAMMIYGAILIIGAASGGNDVFKPISLGSTLSVANEQKLSFSPIKGVDGLQQQLKQSNGYPVMLDFYADWCVECKHMERTTFIDKRVQQVLSQAKLLKADVTANDVADRALLNSLELLGPPAILFFDKQGDEIREFRLDGYRDADTFHAHLLEVFARCNTLSC